MSDASKARDVYGDVRRGFRCPECEEICFSYSSRTFYVIENYEYVGGQTITTTEPDTIEGYECDEGCSVTSEDEPEFTDLWICRQCETLYTDSQDAAECCT